MYNLSSGGYSSRLEFVLSKPGCCLLVPPQEVQDDEGGGPPSVAPPPLPPDYSGDPNPTLGWVNPAVQPVNQVTSPTSNPVHDEWSGGWGSSPAVKEENGADPWDYVQPGPPEVPKVTGQNVASTNQVIG